MNTPSKNIFFQALEMPPSAREDFLAQACGADHELLREVQRLLADSELADSYFGDADRTTLGSGGFTPAHGEKEGDVVGPYKLRQQIGEGGFGTVWMAEQSVPISRMVALKVIKAGMDTKEVLARFEAERQALAIMDHPNIAKVLDAGATQSGRPYFVMELVKGMTITRYCDEAGLGTKERLALFSDVCSAIQHAHQKGVIHRDIKPSNVMVTLHGDKSVVKVIDFGIAKATQGKLTDKTLFTRFEQMIGTPVYMSPEQASLSGLDIDTRSDIYALGILLYELLVGKPPFDSKSLLSAGYDEMRRIIREVEPVKPSSRLSEVTAEERGTLSKNRQISPEKLSRSVEPDIDWIVMKAIEKDRARRYATANAFAQDISRFLAKEPVSAGPPTVSYRLKKFVQRNRRSLLSGAAAVAALLIGLAVAGGVWLNSTFQKQERITRAIDLIGQAEQRLEQNAAADLDKDVHFREARELAMLAGEALAGIPLPEAEMRARSERLNQTIAFEEKARTLVAGIELATIKDKMNLNTEKKDAPTKANSLATTFADFGINPLNESVETSVKSITATRKALQDHILAGLSSWAESVEKTNPDQAARLKEIIDRTDTDPWRRELRRAINAGDAAALESLASREEIARQPTTTVFQLSSALEDKQLAGAMEKLLRRAQREAPASYWTNFILGSTLMGAIDREPGSDIRVQKLSIGESSFGSGLAGALPKKNPERPEFAETIGFLRAAAAARPGATAPWIMLGVALSGSGHLDEAVGSYRTAFALDPETESIDLLLGNALLAQGLHKEALPHLRRDAERNSAEDGWGYYMLGTTLAQLGEYDEARTVLRNYVKRASEKAQDPAAEKGSEKLTFMGKEVTPTEEHVHLVVALAQNGRGDSKEALASAQHALDFNPNSAGAHLLRGFELVKMGESDAALLSLQKAIGLDPGLAAAHNGLGMNLMSRRDFDGAIVSIRRAIELEPKDASAHCNLGAALGELGKFEEAIASIKTALELAPDYALAWNNLGAMHEREGNLDGAAEHFRKAASLDPGNTTAARRNLAKTLWKIGKHEEAIATCRQLNDAGSYVELAGGLIKLKMLEEAIDALQRAITVEPDLVAAHHDLGATYLQSHRYQNAIEPLRTATRLAPKMASAHNQLGLALLFNGNYDEGINSIMEAVQLEPNSEAFKNAQLTALLYSGRITAAGVAHGPSDDAECPITLVLEKNKQVKQLLETAGPDAAELKPLLGSISAKLFGTFFTFASSRPSPATELRAVWNDRQDEVTKHLASATVRIIQIRKASEKHPGASKQERRATAEGILQKLNEGGDFGELAEAHSESWAGGKPQTEAYGNLPGDLNAAAFSLEEGGFTRKLIEDDFAFYLLKVESRQKADSLSFEDPKVQQAINAVITQQRHRDWEQRYLAQLQKTGPDLILAKVAHLKGESLIAEEHPAEAKALFEQADLAGLNPEDAKSVESAMAAVDALKNRANRKEDDLVVALVDLGFAYQKAIRFEDAAASLVEAGELARKAHSGEHATVASCLYYLGMLRLDQGEYKQAVEPLQASLEMRRKLKISESKVADSLNYLGLGYQKMGQLDKAQQHLQEALKIRQQIWGDRDKRVAQTLNLLGNTCKEQARFDEAETNLRRAIEIFKGLGEESRLDLATALANLGGTFRSIGKTAEAVETLNEAIGIYETLEPKTSDRGALPLAYSNLGLVFIDQGKKAEAKIHFEKALKLHDEVRGPEHVDRLVILNNLAMVLPDGEAEQVRRETLDLAIKRLGPDHATISFCLLNLAQSLDSNGKKEEALSTARRGLEMARRFFPNASHPTVMMALGIVAQIQTKLGNFTEAEENIKEAEKMAREVYGGMNLKTAECLSIRAEILRSSGRNSEAEALMSEVLEIKKKLSKEGDFSVASELANQGVRMLLTDSKRAENLFREALTLQRKAPGAEPRDVGMTLGSLAAALRDQKQFPEARKTYLEALSILRQQSGVETEEAVTLSGMGVMARAEGNPAEAEKILRQALAIFEKIPNSDAVRSCKPATFLGLADALWDQKKYPEAEETLQKALTEATQQSGGESLMVAGIRQLRASLLAELERFTEAEKEQRAVLQLRKKLQGSEHLHVGSAFSALAKVLASQGKFSDAEDSHREALAIRRKLLGAKHLDVGISLSLLADVLMQQDKWSEAEEVTREALVICRNQEGAEDEMVGSSLVRLGNILNTLAKYPEAESSLREALALMKKRYGETHQQVALTLTTLGKVLVSQKKFHEAEARSREALDLMVHLKGKDDRESLVCLNNLAEILEAQDKNGEAEEIYRKVLSVMEKIHGPNHPQVSIILNNLGRSLAAQDKFAEAENVIRKALLIQKTSMGAEHPACQNSLAKVLRDQGKFEEADPLFQRVLESCEKMFGPEHPNTATCLIGYITSLEKQKKFEDAKPLAERALRIQEKALPPGHPDLEDTYDVLSKIHTGLGKKEDASKYEKLAEAIREKAANLKKTAKDTAPEK